MLGVHAHSPSLTYLHYNGPDDIRNSEQTARLVRDKTYFEHVK